MENRKENNWTTQKKLAFRITGIYFLLLCVPSYSNFYNHLFHLKFHKLTYHDFQEIVAFWPPQLLLIESEEGVFGILNYVNLSLVLLLSIIAGGLWHLLDKKTKDDAFDRLHYWVTVLVRYRLAFGMVGWGLKKAFPMQMVYPTIGMLNTPFIDMAEKKLYWSHVGVSFGYTVFLGFAEIIPGLLLLHRKTASLGGALAAVVCFNITLANHAFDAGVAVPAAYFTLLGLFVTWYDLPKIWQLLVKENDVAPYRYHPLYTRNWQKITRFSLKWLSILVFVPVTAGFWAYGFFNGNNYNIPSTPGIKGLTGYYEVEKFILNGKELPYRPDDSVRWQYAVFEKWSSLGFLTNRPAFADRMIGYSPLRVKGDKNNNELNQVETQDSDQLYKKNRNRDLGVTRWEIGGMPGSRRYFFYEADTTKQILYLQNKNKLYQNEKQVLHYKIAGQDRVILAGINEFKDSIYVELAKIHKRYPLVEGRKSTFDSY